MSEPVKLEANRSAAVAMRVFVRGRIEASRTWDGKRYTHVMTPAADEYSRPQLVEIRSKQRMGDKGDQVQVICTLGGFSRKPYKSVDKTTGEVTVVTPVDHTLDLVESE